MRRRIVVAALIALSAAAVAAAQSPAAIVVGRVQDSSGALLAGAALLLRNVDTNDVHKAVTDVHGEYAIPDLPPGEYDVTVTREGFMRVHQTGLELEVDETARLDYTLQPGSPQEVVELVLEQPLVNTEKAGEGEVVEQKEMAEVPLADRDFTSLGLFTPGVAPNAQGGGGSTMAINGARADNTNFVVDGFNDQNPKSGGVQVKPPIDAMQEFKMQTTGYPAEYGRLAGGVMNMVLKSGTNRLHGTLFEFVRNDAFDARNFFDASKSALRRNQFGAMLNGPVALPRFYNGRDRTFFLFAWERHRQTGGNNRLSRVPTELERQGDFSRTLDSAGKLLLLKDPLASGNCNANSSAACFPGNRIPASRMSPVALKILPTYPLPNRPDQVNNHISSVKDIDAWDSLVFKVDRKLGSRDNLSFRLLMRRNNNTNPFSGSDLGAFGNKTHQRNSLAGLAWTRPLTAGLIHEFRAGFVRTTNTILGQRLGHDYAAEFGISGVTSDPSLIGFPRITVRDLAPLGDPSSTPNIWAVNNYQYLETVTWVKSRHVAKFGAEALRNQFFQSSTATNARGTFNFLGRWSNVPFADFLLGFLNDSTRGLGKSPSYLFKTSYGFFAQDDFKALPNLTLNLGLRYEIVKPPLEKYGVLGNFVPELGQLILADDRVVPDLNALVAQAGLTGRVALARDYGLPSSLVYTDYLNLAPRFGFAWRPRSSSRAVVRGGYGIFYSTSEMDPIRQDLTGMFPLKIAETYSKPATNPLLLTLSDPFPAGRGAFQGTNNLSGYDLHAPIPYLQSWNVATQREVLRMSIEIMYVGSKGTHLGRQYNWNMPLRDPNLRNPDGSFPKPFQEFNRINLFTFGSNSIYNAAMFSLRSRLAKSFFYRMAYTYGKSIDYASEISGASEGGYSGAIDARNLRLERGRSDWDMGHAFNLNARYETSSRHRLFHGWQLSGTLRVRTGQPFTPQVSNVDLNLGESNRPDRIAKGRLDARSPEMWFDLAAFPQIPRGSYRPGTSGRNILDGAGDLVTNASLMKRFWIKENVWAQFRWEAFNALNHANFLMPNVNVNAAAGGTVTRADPGRVMQLGLKVQF